MSEIGKADVGGYVYVIGFSNGLVKVGHTTNPKVRLSAIKGSAETFGAAYATNWLSPLHLTYRENETVLIAEMQQLGGVSAQREYFRGVSFEQAVSKAQALTFPSFDAHEEAARVGDEGRAFRDRVLDRAMANSGDLDSPLAPFFHSPEVLAEHERRKAEREKETVTAAPNPAVVIGGLLRFLSPADLHDVICLALNALEARDCDVLIDNDTIETTWADISKGEDNRYRSLYYDPKIEEAADARPMFLELGAA